MRVESMSVESMRVESIWVESMRVDSLMVESIDSLHSLALPHRQRSPLEPESV